MQRQKAALKPFDRTRHQVSDEGTSVP